MGKHDKDNDKDGQWPKDKPLPIGTILDDEDGYGKHSKDDETAEEAEEGEDDEE